MFLINVTLTEEQKQQAAKELDLNSLLRIVLSKTMVNEDTMEIASKIHEYLKNEGRKEQQQQEEVKTLEVEQQEHTNTQEPTIPITIREYIINYDLEFWQDRLTKLKEISAPNIIIESIQQEINNLESGKLALKTGKKLSESPAMNPVIKKINGDYVLIEFDCEKSVNGIIEYCRKGYNRYVRNY